MEENMKNNFKLKEKDVIEICEMINAGKKNTEIAQIFNVSEKHISNIRNGSKWSKIGEKYLTSTYTGNLSEDYVLEICKDIDYYNLTNEEIALKFSVTPKTIDNIRKGKTHIEITTKYLHSITRQRILTEEEIKDICIDLNNEIPTKIIARKYDISIHVVYRIKNGITYVNIANKYLINIKKRNTTIGIYRIRNIINNKMYIGQSININYRFQSHRTTLKSNKNDSKRLQQDYNKYGAKCFKFEILEIVKNIDLLNEREAYWINFYNSCDEAKGYNVFNYGNNPDYEINNLKVEEVIEICKLINDKKTNREIASMYNVSETQISNIKTRRTWSKIGNEFLTVSPNKKNTYLTERAVLGIWHAIDCNELMDKDIGLIFNTSAQVVNQVKKNRANKLVTNKYKDLMEKSVEIYNICFPHKNILSESDFVEMDILMICNDLNCDKLTNKDIAIKFNINISMINIIKNSRPYNEIIKQYAEMMKTLIEIRKEYLALSVMPTKTKLSKRKVMKIYYDIEFNKLTTKELSEKYGVSDGAISNIRNGKAYKELINEYEILKESFVA